MKNGGGKLNLIVGGRLLCIARTLRLLLQLTWSRSLGQVSTYVQSISRLVDIGSVILNNLVQATPALVTKTRLVCALIAIAALYVNSLLYHMLVLM